MGSCSTCLYWPHRESRTSDAGKALGSRLAKQLVVAVPWRCVGPRSRVPVRREVAFLVRKVVVPEGLWGHVDKAADVVPVAA